MQAYHRRGCRATLVCHAEESSIYREGFGDHGLMDVLET